MKSVYDELMDRIEQEESLRTRGSARRDLGILLFSRRAEFGRLWKAAKRAASLEGADGELRAAVEALRPLFGER